MIKTAEYISFINRSFNSGRPLKDLVKHGIHKHYSKSAIVRDWVILCRKHGYSGQIPRIVKKPIALDWIKCGDVEYSPELNLYWDGKNKYCEVSARHNGLIGLGVVLKNQIKECKS